MFNALLLFFLFLFFIFLILGTLAYGGILAAPWVPLKKRDIHRLLSLAKIRKGERLYDLGSGDGRILIAAARDFQAQCVGFEVAILPFLIAYVKIAMSGLRKQIRLLFRNFYHYPLNDAQVVVAFLSPRAMEKLKEKFERELHPGTRVVSYVFKIPGWKPSYISKPREKDCAIYYYIIPPTSNS